MRPRKRILLVEEEEANISTLRLVLEVNMFRPLYAADLKAAVIAAAPPSFVDLILVHNADPQAGENIIAALKSYCAWTPMVLVSSGERSPDYMHSADAFWGRKMPAVEMLERVRVMSQRKRGPRKGVARLPQLATA